MKKQLAVLVSLVAFFGLMPKAAAQYTGANGTQWNNPMSAGISVYLQGNMQMQNLMIQQSIQRSALDQAIEQGDQDTLPTAPSQSEDDSSTSAPTHSGGTTGDRAVTTSFNPVADSLIPKQIAARISDKPEEQQEYAENFNTLIDFYKSYVQDSKWQLNDVAHAISYYIGANYYVYKDGKEISDRQRTALYETVSKFLAENKDYRALSDAEKQEMYEVMAIQGSLPLLGYKSATEEGNKEASQRFRRDAEQNLENFFGVPVAKVQFTDEGIVFQK